MWALCVIEIEGRAIVGHFRTYENTDIGSNSFQSIQSGVSQMYKEF